MTTPADLARLLVQLGFQRDAADPRFWQLELEGRLVAMVKIASVGPILDPALLNEVARQLGVRPGFLQALLGGTKQRHHYLAALQPD